MAANVLNSPQATQMSVYVVRAFVKMRPVLSDNRQLAKKLAELEKELKSRLDLHETAIVEVPQRVMDTHPGLTVDLAGNLNRRFLCPFFFAASFGATAHHPTTRVFFMDLLKGISYRLDESAAHHAEGHALI